MSLENTPDSELNADDLKRKYDALTPGTHWSEHPVFTLIDWSEEAGQLDTQLGYWDWVKAQIEQSE